MHYDLIVIGCGVVGAAVARLASLRGLGVLVLEAAHDVACGASKANSAILHAGFDPEPGTLMAKTNVRGVELCRDICAELDVPRHEIGALVLGFGQEDLAHLELLLERGRQNGVGGLRIVGQAELRALEPGVSLEATAALYAPSSAVVDPWELTLAMTENALANGARLELGARVTAIRRGDGFEVETDDGRSFACHSIVNAAGVEAGAVHRLIGGSDWGSRPTRGEYYLLDKSAGHAARHTLFQCPTAAGKGVLVSPTVHGNLIVGPNAELIADGHATETTAAGLAEVAAAARRSLPKLPLHENIRNFAGIRAACDADDFIIAPSPVDPAFINLAGIKSPGLSSAPAIAEMALELLGAAGVEFVDRPDAIRGRKRVRFRDLDLEERQRLIAADPAWGRVVCRCETITEAEIVAAIHGPVPATSIDAVKRHAGAGMGRCQGGFCGPRVQALLARELGLSYADICQHEPGSHIVLGPLGAPVTEEGGAL
ncbi:MAG: NAD(P)/FAD-dependent oxidoreductase [Bacillota bacterium]|nr:NAD(P)/FAD-dependent oxidoreductase [Bacillota bacterium]